MNLLHSFFFSVYPYICLAVFLMGSLARFDRDQYTWKSDSSQLLRKGQFKWGSNLFHVGILFLFFGHSIGLLTPHWVYESFISPANKQLLAIIAGGVAGTLCFIGLSMLLHRRIFDPRIRLTGHRTDLMILIILWIQLVLGLITLPFSLRVLLGAAVFTLMVALVHDSVLVSAMRMLSSPTPAPLADRLPPGRAQVGRVVPVREHFVQFQTRDDRTAVRRLHVH